MPLPAVNSVTGTGVHVPGDDLDTDQIIPARYLRCVTFEGLGEHLFEDLRAAAGGAHPLDDARFRGASVFVTGRNFGCGSSREHAPQSMYRFGIRALIAESFAEIFLGNATTLGMPCAAVQTGDARRIGAWVQENPEGLITIDVEKTVLRFGGAEVSFRMPEGARNGMLDGSYDALETLLGGAEEARAVAAKLPYTFKATGGT